MTTESLLEMQNLMPTLIILRGQLTNVMRRGNLSNLSHLHCGNYDIPIDAKALKRYFSEIPIAYK